MMYIVQNESDQPVALFSPTHSDRMETLKEHLIKVLSQPKSVAAENNH